MEQFDGVVIESISMIGDTVWFVAGEYYGDDDLFAAYRFRRDTGDYETIVRGEGYNDCLAAIAANQTIAWGHNV
jgi:hypothetical protein